MPQPAPSAPDIDGALAARVLTHGIGRRAMLRAAVAAGGALEHSMASPAAASPGHGGANGPAPGPCFPILQPGTGRTPGTYVPARAGDTSDLFALDQLLDPPVRVVRAV